MSDISSKDESDCGLCSGTGEVDLLNCISVPCPYCISREFAEYRRTHEMRDVETTAAQAANKQLSDAAIDELIEWHGRPERSSLSTVLALRELKEFRFFNRIPKASPEKSAEMIAEARRQGRLPPETNPERDPELQAVVEGFMHKALDRRYCPMCTRPKGTHHAGCGIAAINALLNSRVPKGDAPRDENVTARCREIELAKDLAIYGTSGERGSLDAQ